MGTNFEFLKSVLDYEEELSLASTPSVLTPTPMTQAPKTELSVVSPKQI
jgi:hypothetical protein